MAERNQGFSTRLKQAMLVRGFNRQNDFAQELGISPNSMTAYAAKGKVPEWQVLLEIARKLDASVDWLLTGISDEDHSGSHPESATWSDSYIEVPLYEAKLSGGNGAEVISEKPVDRLSFKRDWFVGQKGMAPEEAALMFVTGDSMEPTFYDGDLVLINKANKTIYGGGVYAVRWENRLIIKRLSLSAPGKLRVASDNEKFYPPIEVDADNSVEVIGKVVWFCRDLRM